MINKPPAFYGLMAFYNFNLLALINVPWNYKKPKQDIEVTVVSIKKKIDSICLKMYFSFITIIQYWYVHYKPEFSKWENHYMFH